jgi:CheY-like chemotaxis protein
MLAELGCAVVEAANGEEAAMILADRPDLDLLFTDCMMPGRLDGPGLALEARRLVPSMPILFTSGVRDDVALPAEERNLRFLAKPYTIAQLSDALVELSGGRSHWRNEGRANG